MDWGSAVVGMLVPQRRPFVMLDRVTRVVLEPTPTLEGCRHITANDPVFDGHFPGAPIWPGVMTIEGLAQASSALMAILELAEVFGAGALLEALDHVELGATMQPGHDPARVAALRQHVAVPRTPGLFGAADVKLLFPVFPGCRLDYRVTLVRKFGDLIRLDGLAMVNQRKVAAGTLSGSRSPLTP